MSDFSVRFCYGRCPLCGKTIAIPVDVNEVHCCYCGGSFLAKAAVAFYGLQKAVRLTTIPLAQAGEKTEARNSELARSGHELPYMMSINEVSKASGMSYSAIRGMILEGKIPAIRLGTKYMINVTKFNELVNQGLL